MNNEIRLSLSAAREDDSQPLHIATEGSLNQLPTKHRYGWTPAPTKPAYSQTNVSLEYKGRDYDAILRAAKRKPVGYWEDAPRGAKFNQDIDFIEPNPPSKELRDAYNQALRLFEAKIEAAVTAPTPTQSADGPWPKWLIVNTYLRRFDGPTGGCVCYHRSGNVTYDLIGGWDLWSDDPRVCSQAEAAQWLEQNGHKDAAAQLRGKAADDGLYEPVGTIPVAGDVVRWGGDLITITRIDSSLHFSVRFNRASGREDGLSMSYFSDRIHAPLRILKRKPTAQTIAAIGL